MKKDFRKINLLALPVLFFLIGGIFLSFPAMAQAKDFEADFEYNPLFSEANFLPGDSVPRWIKVTNNSSGIFKIATKADKWIDNDGLGDVLNLEIKQGVVSYYNDTLSNFFNAGELFLSDLSGNGTQTQYDYIISFNPGTGNTYQGKSLSFDILIGYQSSVVSNGGTYAFVGGGYSTTTTIPPTTTTIPGEVAGEATKREFFEEVGEEGTTTTTPPSKFVAGISTIGPFSCPVNLTMTGINPLLASLLCLGQNTCDTCLNPLIILLLGIVITLGSTILVKKYYG